MHLVGPYLTTTSYKKRKEKITKSKQEEFERGWRDRNVRLKDMGLPKETFEQYMEFVHGRCKKTAGQKNTGKEVAQATSASFAKKKSSTTGISQLSDNKNTGCSEASKTTRELDSTSVHSLSSWVTGPCSSKPTPTYTGTKILGVAVLHKSCLQPVFSQEEATDIARMRR
jgi:hypothetical protein